MIKIIFRSLNLFWILIMSSCNEYNHHEIFLNCSRDETQKIIYNQNRIDVSLIQEGEVIFNKIILNYEFSIKLPKRYESEYYSTVTIH